MKASNPFTQLCIDAYQGTVSSYSTGNEACINKAVRESFFEILGEDKITHRNWKKHKDEIYEIIEESLNLTLPNAWNESQFYNTLVEVRNGLLGVKNEFVVNDPSTLVVAEFSGNHYTTDRQKLPGKRSFSLPTSWLYIDVYDDLERFLLGITTVQELFEKLRESFQKHIDSKVYSAFVGAGAYLPAVFTETGTFVKDNMLDLIMRVQVATGKTARIAGTKQGIAKLPTDTFWISENMKDERHTSGRLRSWEGIETIEIPQVFVPGTYDFKVSNTMLYILPDGSRPVKLWYEGDTRTREVTAKDADDQTVTNQVQTKVGVGVVFDNLFGTYDVV